MLAIRKYMSATRWVNMHQDSVLNKMSANFCLICYQNQEIQDADKYEFDLALKEAEDILVRKGKFNSPLPPSLPHLSSLSLVLSFVSFIFLPMTIQHLSFISASKKVDASIPEDEGTPKYFNYLRYCPVILVILQLYNTRNGNLFLLCVSL